MRHALSLDRQLYFHWLAVKVNEAACKTVPRVTYDFVGDLPGIVEEGGTDTGCGRGLLRHLPVLAARHLLALDGGPDRRDLVLDASPQGFKSLAHLIAPLARLPLHRGLLTVAVGLDPLERVRLQWVE